MAQYYGPVKTQWGVKILKDTADYKLSIPHQQRYSPPVARSLEHVEDVGRVTNGANLAIVVFVNDREGLEAKILKAKILLHQQSTFMSDSRKHFTKKTKKYRH